MIKTSDSGDYAKSSPRRVDGVWRQWVRGLVGARCWGATSPTMTLRTTVVHMYAHLTGFSIFLHNPDHGLVRGWSSFRWIDVNHQRGRQSINFNSNKLSRNSCLVACTHNTHTHTHTYACLLSVRTRNEQTKRKKTHTHTYRLLLLSEEKLNIGDGNS